MSSLSRRSSSSEGSDSTVGVVEQIKEEPASLSPGLGSDASSTRVQISVVFMALRNSVQHTVGAQKTRERYTYRI